MKISKFILLLFAVCLSSVLWAGTARNVRVSQQGKQIVIKYDLDEMSNVGLEVSYYTSPDKKQQKTVNLTKSGSTYHVTGDVGFVKPGNNKTIIWDVLKDNDEFIAYETSFFIRTANPYTGTKTVLIGEYAYSLSPQHSYGLMFGQVYKYAGWYINAHSNFKFDAPSKEFVADRDGYVNLPTSSDGRALPLYTGQTRDTHYMLTGGLLVDLAANKLNRSMIALYTGVGYGVRSLQWCTVANQWIEYGPNSFRGYCVEGGIIASIKGFSLMAGVSTIQFKYIDLQFGIGWTFNHKSKK